MWITNTLQNKRHKSPHSKNSYEVSTTLDYYLPLYSYTIVQNEKNKM